MGPGRFRGRVLRRFDPWGSPLCTCPPKYSLHPYTGCSHMCLYCYATAYIGVRKSAPKNMFLKRLMGDLRRADRRLVVEMSTSSDPYPPEEKDHRLTRMALGLLIREGFKVLITTKGSLVLRDVDLLKRGATAVMMTITTLDEGLARLYEPGAPPPKARLKALETLSRAGVPVGVRIDPIIPGLNDDPDELKELVRVVWERGVRFIVTSTYKARPDSLSRLSFTFPDMAEKWRRLYRSEGVWMGGYWYLDQGLRKRLLTPILKTARRLGMEYAVCREGFKGKEFFNSESCDGSHLITDKRRGES